MVCGSTTPTCLPLGQHIVLTRCSRHGRSSPIGTLGQSRAVRYSATSLTADYPNGSGFYTQKVAE